MLLKQEGKKCVDPATGENIGWNDAPFYWPVLMSQQNINPVMFALEQGKKKKAAATDNSDILEGIDPKDVLCLTFGGDLVDRFGPVGSEYAYGDECPWESRSLKESTASRYLEKDENGKWKMNPEVPFNLQQDHGLYSLNDGKFPFVFKSYKYMLLRNKRDATADLMLLELFPSTLFKAIPEGKLNEKGDLVDRDTQKILLHGKDTILDKDMTETEFTDTSITQWIIFYYVRKVVKYVPCNVDWNTVFDFLSENDNVDD